MIGLLCFVLAVLAAPIKSKIQHRNAITDKSATMTAVWSMLGISPSAWEEAQTVLGETQAAVVVACILQRGTTIR
jgi:hypothetical protein